MVTPPPQGAGLDNVAGTQAIIDRIANTPENQTFLETLHE